MDKPIQISFTTATVFKIVLFAVGLWLVYTFANLLLLILAAVVIASAVEPAVEWFERFNMPRVAATFIVYVILFAIIIGILFTVIPSLLRETINFISLAPQYLQTLELFLNERLAGYGFSTEGGLAQPLAEFRSELTAVAGSFLSGATGTIGFFFGSLFNFILVIVLSFYFTAQKYGIDNFLKIIIPPDHSAYAINLWRRSQRKIALWMQGQLVLALIIFVMTYLGLLILGVEYAFLLAVVAAVGELIPLVGPIISAVPAIGVAFGTEGLYLALWVLGLYIIIQQLESNLIYPLVVKKVVGVPALLVIIGLIVGGTLFGILGMILSVPVAAALMEFIKDIEKRHKAREAILKQAGQDVVATTSKPADTSSN